MVLTYFPLILRLSSNRELYTGLAPDSYLYRWLLVTAAVLWSTTGLFVKFDALRADAGLPEIPVCGTLPVAVPETRIGPLAARTRPDGRRQRTRLRNRHRLAQTPP